MERELPKIEIDFGDGSYEVLTDIIGSKYKDAGYLPVIPLSELKEVEKW